MVVPQRAASRLPQVKGRLLAEGVEGRGTAQGQHL